MREEAVRVSLYLCFEDTRSRLAHTVRDTFLILRKGRMCTYYRVTVYP